MEGIGWVFPGCSEGDGMMVQKIDAWLASDGSIHRSEQDAEDKEVNRAASILSKCSPDELRKAVRYESVISEVHSTLRDAVKRLYDEMCPPTPPVAPSPPQSPDESER